MNRTRALPPWFSLACLAFLPARSMGCVRRSARRKGRPIPPGSQSQKDEPTFRVNVRLVNVFTTVTDLCGAPVANLTKDDFQLLEDGIPQTIKVFEKESAIPLSIALAIDTSPSTMRDFKLETSSARRLSIPSCGMKTVSRFFK